MKFRNLINYKLLLLLCSNNFFLIGIVLYLLFFIIQPIRAQKSILEIEEILNYLEQGYTTYSFESFKNLSTKNDINAQFYLAECYYYGIGIQKNKEEAFKLYRKAAERGLPDAMSKLSIIYQNGEIISSNEQKALEWKERFQKKGGINILPNLYNIAIKGLNQPQNFVLNPIKLKESNKTSYPNSQTTINNITVVQTIQPENNYIIDTNKGKEKNRISDVDEINQIQKLLNNKSFVLIIANENYQEVENVPNATHDGEIFREYCYKLLGIPENNIHFIKDATLNNIKRELNLISQIAEEYKGEANIILYYAGHGIPDEKTKNPFIVPVDGYSSDISTCYPTGEIYSKLGRLPTNKIIIFMDACFSGSLRGEGMLTSSRGISIKSNSQDPKGKMVILSAAQGDETAYSYEEEGHGMFTYYLLKHLKDSNGEITLKDLFEKVESDVRKQSLIMNGKRQTPNIQYSSVIEDLWSDWKLNE